MENDVTNQKVKTDHAVYIIAIVSGLMLIAHLLLKIKYGEMKDGLDGVAIGLTAVGLSPWIAQILESFKFGGVEFKFVKQKLEEQRNEIHAIKFIISSLVAKYELEHLKKLASGAEVIVDKEFYPDDFQREIRHLRDLGLVDNYPGKGVRALYAEPGRYKNLREFFHITERGKTYLKLRADVDAEEPKAFS